MANKRITEIITIRRGRPCGKSNELFLGFLNSRGGIDTFLFEAHYATARNSSNSVLIGKTAEDYATAESIISMVKKDSIKELSLIAPQADLQTRTGLAELFATPISKMLLNPLDWDEDGGANPIWQDVIVLDGRTDMGDTDELVFDFPVRIQLQPIQTLWG